MLRHHPFLAVAFFLLLFCHASSKAYADENYTRRVTLLEGGMKQFVEEKDKNVSREFDSFGAPVLVNVNEKIVAITEVSFRENNKSFVGIASGSLVSNMGASGALDALKMDDTVAAAASTRRLVDVFFGSNRHAKVVFRQTLTSSKWIKNLATARVKDKGNSTFDFIRLTSGNGDSVNMGFTEIYAKFLENVFKKRSLTRLVGVGVGIWMEDGTFVLPVQMMRNDERMVSLVLRYESSAGGWKFSERSEVLDCTNSSVVEWKAGKLFMIVSCDRGYRKVYESMNKGETWTEAVGTLSRVWGNSQQRDVVGGPNGFISAEIDGTKVMLFAHSVFLKDGTPGQLRLWMTDNTRILNVSLISTKAEKVTASSLLYKDDKLYCLYETHNGRRKIIFAELTGALGRIKHVLKVWNELDNSLSKHCSAYGAVSAVPGGKCTSSIPTAGLVGVLANRSSGARWDDEYRCVGAKLTNATKIPNGFLFRGAGAGAQWPVSKQGQSQRYHFANIGFTLAATVALHAIPTGVSPVLGVSLGESGLDKLLALSITSHRHWLPIYGDSWFRSTGRWEINKEYQVVFTWHGGRGSIYLDGVPMPRSNEVLIKYPADIKYFYFGGYGTGNLFTANEVSVANVLLYNRPLNDSEVKALLQIKATIPVPPADERIVHVPRASRPAVKHTPQRTVISHSSGSFSAPPRVFLPPPPQVDVTTTLAEDADGQTTILTHTVENDQIHTENDGWLNVTSQVAEPPHGAGSVEGASPAESASTKDTMQETQLFHDSASPLPEMSALNTKTDGVKENVLRVHVEKVDAEERSAVKEQMATLGASQGRKKADSSLRSLLNMALGNSTDSTAAVCVSYAVLLLLSFWGITTLC